MRAHRLSFFFILAVSTVSATIQDSSARRILHQPLFPENSSPPSPPPPASPVLPTPDQPFFPEVPGGGTPDQAQPPPVTPTNGSIPIPAAAQPSKPTKTVAIAISVGIVTLGMLSALAFFLYRHRVKHPGDTQKLVGAPNSQRFDEDSRVQPSSFLYIGTVEPSTRSSVGETNGVNGSPYHKLNSIKRSDRYRPSPELQPLPPLTRPIQSNFPAAAAAESPPSSDGESQDAAFYTPQCSSVSNEDGSCTPGSRKNHLSLVVSGGAETRAASVPHSKRTSPKSRLSGSSPDIKPVMIPPMKQTPPPPKPPVPPPPPPQLRPPDSPLTAPIPHHQKPRFSAPPPPPNWALLKSKNNSPPSVDKTRNLSAAQGPPPPPPPPPPALLSTPQKLGPIETAESKTPSKVMLKTPEPWTPSPREVSGNGMRKPIEEVENSAGSSARADTDDTDGAKPKLKPLHWDKVRATSDRATVWDQLEPSSFQLNEDMMESLFGCNTMNPATKEPIRRSVLPPVEKENRVLDPKKSQNIAILLRALNVTRDEVSEALLDGNPESLGVELLESLVKMAPTKEEEIKLRDYKGDVSKLGSAERFLKQVLDIPFAFKRVEAMLYRGNFDSELKYLRSSFQTLEAASEELKNSRLFLKLLEAVLRTGNRMNVGTNRGDAKSFKLDTLLKLVDIKGTDGKTTLLHFVVQEIIRTEGEGTDPTSEISQSKLPSKTKEENFRKQGLQVVAGLGRDLINVKKAAGMDSNVLSGYVSKLEMGLEKVRLVLQYEKTDSRENFFHSMKQFLKEAEEEIGWIKAGERKALSLVKDVTQYFHGNATREEPHPFRIFMIVRDFLSILDNVCKEVGRMHDRTMVGSARSFRISATASLPVLNRYNVRQDGSSDEGSSSP